MFYFISSHCHWQILSFSFLPRICHSKLEKSANHGLCNFHTWHILVVRSSLFVTTGRRGWFSADQNIFSHHDHNTIFISLLQSVRNVSEGHVSFSLQVPGTLSQGIKWLEHEADHPLTYIPRLGMSGILPSPPNWFITFDFAHVNIVQFRWYMSV